MPVQIKYLLQPLCINAGPNEIPTPTSMYHPHDTDNNLHRYLLSMPIRVLDAPIMLPLATTLDWQAHTANDHNLQLLTVSLQQAQILHKDELMEQKFWEEWQNNRLELQDGILY